MICFHHSKQTTVQFRVLCPSAPYLKKVKVNALTAVPVICPGEFTFQKVSRISPVPGFSLALK